jgi:hypothetical protein
MCAVETLMTKPKAVKVSLLEDAAHVEPPAVLSGFRADFYDCLTARADVLFELTDALLCADGPVTSLVDLTLTAEHRRGHGALYDALNHGRIQADHLRADLAGLPVPRTNDGRIVLAVDTSPWLRSDAPTSADRLFCHVYGRAKSQERLAVHPRLALLLRGRPGVRAHVLDRDLGRGPAHPCR